MDTGVATRPIADMDAYRDKLSALRLPDRPGDAPGVCRPPRTRPGKRVIYAEGEDERALRAAQVVRDEGLAQLTLIGRPAVIEYSHHLGVVSQIIGKRNGVNTMPA
jgi:malate dehydrogenase (oxaloacetate-decarboxylating)(NADP+)